MRENCTFSSSRVKSAVGEEARGAIAHRLLLCCVTRVVSSVKDIVAARVRYPETLVPNAFAESQAGCFVTKERATQAHTFETLQCSSDADCKTFEAALCPVAH
eukprot:6201827-Pleurochrysis_carterae.AAC.2